MNDKNSSALAPAHQHVNETGLLQVRTAAHWMKQERKKPALKKLFGDFWMQGEICILFADTNMGKSILAVQLADCISRQQPINGFAMEIKASPVLYIDFELTTKQFEMRYADGDGKHYHFNKNFYRAEVDLQAELPKNYRTFTDFMAHAVGQAVTQTGARVLIIDNITCLGGGTEQAGAALHMMRALKKLKLQHGLSILVLAHTPKRTLGKPITQNDLGGSKMLINFADSAFAMGNSGIATQCRYLKQIKQRAAAQKYHDNNVCVLRLEKNGAFLGFSYVGQALECLHLRRPAHRYSGDLVPEAAKLQQQGYTQRQIADLMSLSASSVNRLLAAIPQRAEYFQRTGKAPWLGH